MSAGERRWTVAVLALVAVGVATVAWLAWPAPRSETGAIHWDDIAPAAPPRAWRWIVIHHSATPGGTTAGIDREHRRRHGWDGIGYHFVLGNGHGMPHGRIEATFRWRGQGVGAHAGSGAQQQPYNDGGIGICVVGDWRGRRLDPLLEGRLAELCALLIRRHPGLAVERVIGHGDVPGKDTDCPGSIDLASLRARIAERLR